jgi:O-Antigen ligase
MREPMSRAGPFTQPAVARAIKAALKHGLPVTGMTVYAERWRRWRGAAPNTPIFRNRSGAPYSKDTLGDAPSGASRGQESLSRGNALPALHRPPIPYNSDHMSAEEFRTAEERHSNAVGGATAAAVTIAAFTKWFVPFYLIGSTAIFVAACLAGAALIAVDWRGIFERIKRVKDFLLIAASLYALVVANYFVFSSKQVPFTYLLGVLAFHGLFLLFGFVAARSLRTIYALLLLQAAIYLIIIARYTIVSGDLMRNGFLQDVFGIGEPALVTALHQHIGIALSLALLAALGLGPRWTKLSALVALPLLLLFMFHIAARTGLVALLASLFFLLGANLWVRSKKAAILALTVVFLTGAIASKSFYDFALRDKRVDAIAPDAVSRTVRELQSHDPEFRIQIWRRAWERINARPDHLFFGRGVGSYSIDEGFGPPTWLLDKSPKHYVHNAYLEMLYETGIVGLLIFGALTILPLLASLGYWSKFGAQERAAISMYVFYLVGSQVSGAFAYDYPFQFFFAIAIGVIGLRRAEWSGTWTTHRPCQSESSA